MIQDGYDVCHIRATGGSNQAQERKPIGKFTFFGAVDALAQHNRPMDAYQLTTR